MGDRDKVRELAEKLIWPDGLMNEKIDSFERILREGLKPLLEACEEAISSRSGREQLDAELEGWLKKE